MKLMAILTVIIALLGAIACGSNKDGKVPPLNIPADISYSVVDTDIIPSIKRSLDVRLNKKVSEDVLRAIALELKSNDSQTYDRTFIVYRLLSPWHDGRCRRLGHYSF